MSAFIETGGVNEMQLNDFFVLNQEKLLGEHMSVFTFSQLLLANQQPVLWSADGADDIIQTGLPGSTVSRPKPHGHPQKSSDLFVDLYLLTCSPWLNNCMDPFYNCII